MIAVSASKLSTADLDNFMRALEIDVVSLREPSFCAATTAATLGLPGTSPA